LVPGGPARGTARTGRRSRWGARWLAGPGTGHRQHRAALL